MNAELEKKLLDKYPKIFAQAYKSPLESCMAFGLEVGDGWYDLIDVLCEALTYTFTTGIVIDEEDGKRLGIEPYVDKEGKPTYCFMVKQPQVVADQVKEKFGTLRFYYHLDYSEDNLSLVQTKKYPELSTINKRYADYIDGIIHFADIASGKTCEVTGEHGELHVRGGWFKTIKKDLIKEKKYQDFRPCEDSSAELLQSLVKTNCSHIQKPYSLSEIVERIESGEYESEMMLQHLLVWASNIKTK